MVGGEVGLCSSCLDSRGIKVDELIEGSPRSTLSELAAWTADADKVLVF